MVLVLVAQCFGLDGQRDRDLLTEIFRRSVFVRHLDGLDLVCVLEQCVSDGFGFVWAVGK